MRGAGYTNDIVTPFNSFRSGNWCCFNFENNRSLRSAWKIYGKICAGAWKEEGLSSLHDAKCWIAHSCLNMLLFIQSLDGEFSCFKVSTVFHWTTKNYIWIAWLESPTTAILMVKAEVYFVLDTWAGATLAQVTAPCVTTEQCGTCILSSSLGESVDHTAVQTSQEGESLLLIFSKLNKSSFGAFALSHGYTYFSFLSPRGLK